MRAGCEEESDWRSSSLAVAAAASTSLFYLRWVTLHLWVFQSDGSAESSPSSPPPLPSFHVLNPHSCSLCVTSSHSLPFFNQLSRSIKPPSPPPPPLRVLLRRLLLLLQAPAQNQMSKKCRRIKSKCVSHIIPDTWEASGDDLLEPIKRQRVVSLDVHYHWCANLPPGCVILAVWWDNWVDPCSSWRSCWR